MKKIASVLFIIICILVSILVAFVGYIFYLEDKTFEQGSKIVNVYNASNTYTEYSSRKRSIVFGKQYKIDLAYKENGQTINLGLSDISKAELEQLANGNTIQREIALDNPRYIRPVGETNRNILLSSLAFILLMIFGIANTIYRWKKGYLDKK
ncbi:hypothetical protein [Volucribacter amazonae]|uniref:Uncharacterized protein n=1 Tax=Volucribacter amazonae TaxID=256731 RepID=A0A9X4PE84_9PAST|nr:hypothetical protein [Volucribacter amazonae]MDG6895654.1 hypothetical protein [Volucribacter amazonae]